MNTKTPPTAVIFDMDDVLCTYDFPERLRLLATSTGLTAEHIEAAVWTSGFEDEADRGIYDADAYLAECARRLGVFVSRSQWLAARAAAMTPNFEVLDLARDLAQRMPTALLTNNGLLLMEAIDDIFPEAPAIFGEHTYFSAGLGLSKPDPAAFQAVTARLGVEPTDALFIDDLPHYIEGAKKAGLHTHHFTGIEALRRALRGFGLI